MVRIERIKIVAVVVLTTACSVAGVLSHCVTGQEKAVPRDPPGRSASTEILQKSPDSTGAAITTIKDVTLTDVDEADGTVSVSFGKKDKSTKLVNIPLAEGVRVVASHVIPTLANHLPFEWQDLKRLKGKVVSIRVQTSATGISVISIAARND